MKKVYKFLLTLITVMSTLSTAFASSDECIDAETITPTANSTVTVNGTFTDATLSTGATSCSATAVQDVWYQFTAISTQARIRVATTINATSLGFTLYKGSCESPAVICVNSFNAMNFGSDSESRLFNDLEVGATYYIRALNFTGSNVAYDITVAVESLTPPVNDLCANPTALTSALTFEGTQGTFQNSGKEITAAPSCYTTNYSQDVWYQFTALESIATIEVKDLAIRSTIQLFNETCGSTAIACATSNSNGSNSNLVASNLIVGNTYKFRVVNSSSTLSSLTFNVGVTYVPTASNDLIENAISLTPSANCQNTTGTFSAATVTGDGPLCHSNSTQDVWYTFVATEKMMRIVLGGADDVDHGFELHNGEGATDAIACVNQAGLHVSEIYTSNAFVIGQTYTIRVFNAGMSASISNFNICVIAYEEPANNDCATAELITPNLECVPVVGSFMGATLPITATCTTASQDVWYKFIATEPEMTISLTGPEGLDHGFKVYAQSCEGASLACINENAMGLEETSQLTELTIGALYFIQVFNATTLNIGAFELCLIGSPTETCPAIVEIIGQTTYCENTSVTFTSTLTNAGEEPVFQWLVNGANVGDNSAELTLPLVNNGDVVQLVIISNATCAPTNAMATSNEITITTQAIVTPDFDLTPSICKDAIIALPTTSENGIVGAWSPVFNNQETTTYTFTPAETVACSTPVTKTIEVISIEGTVSVENKVLTVDNNGASIQWIDCATNTPIPDETSTSFAPSTPGSFAAKLIVNGCEWTSECFSVDNVGINELTSTFTIAPNPFTSTIQITSDLVEATYTVLNTNGQAVQSGSLSGSITNVDLSKLAPGYYYIAIDQQTYKLIKQ